MKKVMAFQLRGANQSVNGLPKPHKDTTQAGGQTTNVCDRGLHDSIQGEEDSEADNDVESNADAVGEAVADGECGSGSGDSQRVWRPQCPASTTAGMHHFGPTGKQ